MKKREQNGLCGHRNKTIGNPYFFHTPFSNGLKLQVTSHFLHEIILKFITGVKPPQKRKTDEEKATYYREYEKTKQARNYASEWKKDRSWLKDSEEGMVCGVC